MLGRNNRTWWGGRLPLLTALIENAIFLYIFQDRHFCETPQREGKKKRWQQPNLHRHGLPVPDDAAQLDDGLHLGHCALNALVNQ